MDSHTMVDHFPTFTEMFAEDFIEKSGTSEGAYRGWETRRGGVPADEDPDDDSSAMGWRRKELTERGLSRAEAVKTMAAVERWTHGRYNTINQSVKKGKPNEDAQLLLRYCETVKPFRSKEPLYRGAEMSTERVASMEPGGTISPAGFWSATPSKYIANEFVGGAWAGREGVVFVIDDHRSAAPIFTVSHNEREREVLFRPGTRFEIVSKKETILRQARRFTIHLREKRR